MTKKMSKTSETGKTVETKRKRLSKGQRKHLRRVKSETHKAVATHS